MPLSDIVNVVISRETASVSQVGFGTALIVGTHKRFNERLKNYSNLAAVALDFETTDKEYIAAANLFGQSPSPVQCAIGRRKVDDPVTISIAVVVDSFDYTVTINGEDMTYTSGIGETLAQIATGLFAAINAGAQPVTATDGTLGDLTVSADVASTPWSLVEGTNITTPAFTVTETPAATMDAIVAASDDFYGVVWTDRTEATVKLVIAWIEAKKKVFFTASADADIIDTTDAADTTTIAAFIKAGAYARSLCIFSGSAATDFADAAAFGSILPLDPGSYNLMFMTLTGIAVDTLTDTQSTNALDKYCSTNQAIGGNNIIREGKVGEGIAVDIIIFVDWLQARITERVYLKMVSLPKIPYTDKGVSIITSEVEAVLQQGIDRGGLTDDPAPTVTAPLVKDVSPVDRGNRFLPDVDFVCTLAGAIEKVQINGIVQV